MKFGLIVLGRIGSGLACQAMEKGHQVGGLDPSLCSVRAGLLSLPRSRQRGR